MSISGMLDDVMTDGEKERWIATSGRKRNPGSLRHLAKTYRRGVARMENGELRVTMAGHRPASPSSRAFSRERSVAVSEAIQFLAFINTFSMQIMMRR